MTPTFSVNFDSNTKKNNAIKIMRYTANLRRGKNSMLKKFRANVAQEEM